MVIVVATVILLDLCFKVLDVGFEELLQVRIQDKSMLKMYRITSESLARLRPRSELLKTR